MNDRMLRCRIVVGLHPAADSALSIAPLLQLMQWCPQAANSAPVAILGGSWVVDRRNLSIGSTFRRVRPTKADAVVLAFSRRNDERPMMGDSPA